MTADEKAIELGAEKIVGGINWTWAEGFPTQPSAARFLAWLEANGNEHRGIYAQDIDLKTGKAEKFDVRYR